VPDAQIEGVYITLAVAALGFWEIAITMWVHFEPHDWLHEIDIVHVPLAMKKRTHGHRDMEALRLS
jgi:hypothetical protein